MTKPKIVGNNNNGNLSSSKNYATIGGSNGNLKAISSSNLSPTPMMAIGKGDLDLALRSLKEGNFTIKRKKNINPEKIDI